MKKLIVLFSVFVLVAHFSCEKKVTSPEYQDVAIKISDHLLPEYYVTSIAFDSRGAAWIGTFRQGLIKYDGDATVYCASNSALPDSLYIHDVAVDKTDNIWLGTGVGLIKFSTNEFTIYNTSNSPLPENIIWSLAVDDDNILWLHS